MQRKLELHKVVELIMRLMGPARYWMMRRQLFFLEQRLFAVLSFLLLDNAMSSRLRMRLLCALGATTGRDSIVRGGLIILEGFNFIIGDHVYIGSQCTLDGSERITIGNNVVIAYGVTIITGSHHSASHEHRAGPYNPRPMIIEDGCWIGARATLLPGVTVKTGAIVGAGSVVTKDVEPDTVVAGNPARVVRVLDADS